MTGDLSKIYANVGATRANISFLTRCIKHKVIPKGCMAQKQKSGQMEDRSARIRIKETLSALHAKLVMLELHIN